MSSQRLTALRIFAVIIILMLVLVGSVSAADGRQVVAWAKASSGIVQFEIRQVTPPRWSSVCGGTFIAPDRFLTASHCVIATNEMMRVLDFFGGENFIDRVYRSKERDLIVLFLTKSNEKVRSAILSLDVVEGDNVWLVGAPDGQKFMVTRGMISIIQVTHFDNCPGEPEIGTKDQQLFIADIQSTFGVSGGGYFNEQGQLIGVHVRSNYGGMGCTDNYWGQESLWAYAVGPSAIKEFLTEVK